MTLEQLSAAATQGEWKATERSGYHEILAPDDGCDWYGVPKHHAVVYIDTELDDTVQDANAAFIVALVNLYRTGQLVAVQPDDATVERMQEAYATFGQTGHLRTTPPSPSPKQP